MSTEEAPEDGASSIFDALKEEITKDVVGTIARRPPDEDGGVPFEPKPDGAELISEEDYLDAYMAGIRKGNQAGRDRIQRQLDAAAAADAERQ
jgi:hypothetical protein